MYARTSYTGRMYRQRQVRFWLGSLLVVLGLGGLVWGLVLWRNQPNMPAKTPTGVRITAPPAAAKPSASSINNYEVPPPNPKYIEIPTIGVAKTRILSLGLHANGSIVTPSNIYDAGWYNASGKPGQPGVMFIFGHVSSWQARGIFYRLHDVRPGDQISITAGDNRRWLYQVDASQTYPVGEVNMQNVLSPASPGAPTLRLMTCAGSIIRGTSDFTERLIVSAHLEQ